MSMTVDVPDGTDDRLSHGTAVRRAISLLSEAQTARDAAITALLDERRAIEAKLAELGHTEKTRKKAGGRICGTCHEPGHTARTCAKKAGKDSAQPR